MRRLGFLTIGFLLVLSLPAGATHVTPHKAFVCKYVGKPFVDERLQTGQNPIDVDVAAIPEHPVVVGSYFADRQGRSYVLAFDVGQPEPDVSECPAPAGPTTTTTGDTTTTNPGETTTTQSAPTTQPGETTTQPGDTPTTRATSTTVISGRSARGGPSELAFTGNGRFLIGLGMALLGIGLALVRRPRFG